MIIGLGRNLRLLGESLFKVRDELCINVTFCRFMHTITCVREKEGRVRQGGEVKYDFV